MTDRACYRCQCEHPEPLHYPRDTACGIMAGYTACANCDGLIETDAEREAAKDDAIDARAGGN